MYSDLDIKRAIERGALVVEPFNRLNVQPCTLDITLGEGFLVPAEQLDPSLRHVPLDILHQGADMVPWHDRQTVTIPPRGFVLGTTAETVRLDSTIVGKLDGRSSIGRCAVTVHITAGLIDAGYHGQITLELANLRDRPLILHAGMRVGQLEFHELVTPCHRAYGTPGLQSRYQGQRGATTSRLHEIHHP